MRPAVAGTRSQPLRSETRRRSRVSKLNCLQELATPYLHELGTHFRMTAVTRQHRHVSQKQRCQPRCRSAKRNPRQRDKTDNLMHCLISLNLDRGSTASDSSSACDFGGMLHSSRSSAALRTTNSTNPSAVIRKTAKLSGFEVTSSLSRPKLQTQRCQAWESCAWPVADVPVASIDVEFAHFVHSGKINTAAAEVCLLTETGAVLLHSYICPGGFSTALTVCFDDVRTTNLVLLCRHIQSPWRQVDWRCQT